MRTRIFRTGKFCIIFSLALALFSTGNAQVRSGAAFLKMLPGARVQSMAGASAAILDDPHAVFANPGAAGFLRDWQWATSYTRWIADIYNASFIYGGRVPTPWSASSRLALGLLYQGVPEFNNNPAALPPASAGDFVASLSIGQPLSFLSNNIAVGGNLKYFSSTLAQYSASSFVYDLGLTARTRAFPVGKSLSGLLSFGAALNQNGRDLTFAEIGTPLPQTGRAGLAFYLGAHKGMQVLFSADYVRVKDEKGYMAIGAELMVGRLLALNAGYDFGSDLFKKVVFGAGFRLDHVGACLGEAFPGRHNAFRLDFATLDEADLFSRTYRGTASHFPTRPEGFEFLTPADGDSLLSSEVILRWQEAHDPDVFDAVIYHVLVDSSKAKIANIISTYNVNPELFLAMLKGRFMVNMTTLSPFFATRLDGGEYYWTVIARDKDDQVRFARCESGPIARFSIPLPDIKIKDIQFEHNEYITMDDYQGKICVTLTNTGVRPARDVEIKLVDTIDKLDYTMDALAAASNDIVLPQPDNEMTVTLDQLVPGETKTVTFEWRSPLLGSHNIAVVADPQQKILEINRSNNSARKVFYTVPKGAVTALDSLAKAQTSMLLVAMPLITDITFARNSSSVRDEYYERRVIEPILSVIAQRLVENPASQIQLQGFIDPNSDESRLSLASERAEAVKKVLLDLGAAETQIEILPGQQWPKKAPGPVGLESEWLLEERRVVKVSASREDSPRLLRPLRHQDAKTDFDAVQFTAAVTAAAPLRAGVLFLEQDTTRLRQELAFPNRGHKVANFAWQPDVQTCRTWLNKNIGYYVSLTDSLGRQFRTEARSLKMAEESQMRQRILSVPLQFGKTDPLAEFYWQEIFNYAKETMADSLLSMRFEGHACQIGAADVNQKLSLERAQRFDQEFKKYVLSTKDETNHNILSRIEAPIGLGEDFPLQVELLDGPVLLGDPNSSIGRMLNRRIELVFYKNGAEE